MKVKGRLLLRMAEFCPTLLSTCAAASSVSGKERSHQQPQKTSRTPGQQHITPAVICHQPQYLSHLQSPPGGADEISPVPQQTPVPSWGWLCSGQCPPCQSPQEGSWAPPGAPKTTLSPWKGSWLSPNPQPPTHLPGSSPSALRPGQAVPELWSKQRGGGHAREGQHLNPPQILFHCGLFPPPPPTPPTPSGPSCACPHPGLARGHGQAVTQRSQGHTGHRRHEREGGDAGGGPEGVLILTAFACHRHLQLQAGFTVVVNGLGWEGRGKLDRDGGSPMAIPSSTLKPTPLQPPQHSQM